MASTYFENSRPLRSRIDARSQNDPAVAAGMRGIHRGTDGQVIGGYTAEGQPIGTKKSNWRGGGLDSWYAMNPQAKQGVAYDHRFEQNKGVKPAWKTPPAPTSAAVSSPQKGTGAMLSKSAPLPSFAEATKITPGAWKRPSAKSPLEFDESLMKTDVNGRSKSVPAASQIASPATPGASVPAPAAVIPSASVAAPKPASPQPASPFYQGWRKAGQIAPKSVASPFPTGSPVGPLHGPAVPAGGMGPANGPWRQAAAAAPPPNFITGPRATTPEMIKDAVAKDVERHKAHQKRIADAKAAAKEDDWLVGTTAGNMQKAWRRYAANWTP